MINLKQQGLSFVRYEADGAVDTFTVPFEYFNKSDVITYSEGEEVEVEWVNDQEVKITPTPVAGAVVLIMRQTKNDNRYVDFSDGGVLKDKFLDLDSDQIFYLAQEAMDWKLLSPSFDPEAGGLNAKGDKIVNLGEGTDPTDAVNLSQLTETEDRLNNRMDEVEQDLSDLSNRIDDAVTEVEGIRDEVQLAKEDVDEALIEVQGLKDEVQDLVDGVLPNVKSLNDLTGDLNIVAGTNITLDVDEETNSITINGEGGGDEGVSSLGSGTPFETLTGNVGLFAVGTGTRVAPFTPTNAHVVVAPNLVAGEGIDITVEGGEGIIPDTVTISSTGGGGTTLDVHDRYLLDQLNAPQRLDAWSTPTNSDVTIAGSNRMISVRANTSGLVSCRRTTDEEWSTVDLKTSSEFPPIIGNPSLLNNASCYAGNGFLPSGGQFLLTYMSAATSEYRTLIFDGINAPTDTLLDESHSIFTWSNRPLSIVSVSKGADTKLLVRTAQNELYASYKSGGFINFVRVSVGSVPIEFYDVKSLAVNGSGNVMCLIQDSTGTQLYSTVGFNSSNNWVRLSDGTNNTATWLGNHTVHSIVGDAIGLYFTVIATDLSTNEVGVYSWAAQATPPTLLGTISSHGSGLDLGLISTCYLYDRMFFFIRHPTHATNYRQLIVVNPHPSATDPIKVYEDALYGFTPPTGQLQDAIGMGDVIRKGGERMTGTDQRRYIIVGPNEITRLIRSAAL